MIEAEAIEIVTLTGETTGVIETGIGIEDQEMTGTGMIATEIETTIEATGEIEAIVVTEVSEGTGLIEIEETDPTVRTDMTTTGIAETTTGTGSTTDAVATAALDPDRRTREIEMRASARR